MHQKGEKWWNYRILWTTLKNIKHPNDYFIIARDLKAIVRNKPITNIIGTQCETCLNENGKES